MKPMIWLFTMTLGFAAAGEDEARQIWDAEFLQRRPRSEQAPRSEKKRFDYRLVKPPQQIPTSSSSLPRSEQTQVVAPAVTPPPSAQTESSLSIGAAQPTSGVIGVTIWRLRKPQHTDGDEVPRLLVQSPRQKRPAALIPERLRIDDALHENDQVRISIEVPREGYLYVFDRERYNDGTVGQPHLIFPATTFNHGDNRVSPGRLIEIPGQQDASPSLWLTRTGARHVGEELLVVITSNSLKDVTPGSDTTPVSRDALGRWADSSTIVSRLELSGVADKWTKAEQAAGNNARLLTQADPMPQSIFSAVSPAGSPLVLRLLLEVR